MHMLSELLEYLVRVDEAPVDYAIANRRKTGREFKSGRGGEATGPLLS